MQEKPAFRWAAPSWVVPGSVSQNCSFLQGKAPEVALCLFETSACLAYGPEDLPEAPRDLAFHAHLPLDLPWEKDLAPGMNAKDTGKRTAQICLELYAQVAHLAPWCVVLHPPKDMAAAPAMLEAFFGVWREGCACPVLLENTRYCNTAHIPGACLDPASLGADGLCLDLGHLLRYHQKDLLKPCLLAQAAMVHWNLADSAGRHLPLTAMSKEEEGLLGHVMEHVPASAVHVLEIFDWQGVEASLAIVQDLWRRVHDKLA